MKVWKVSMALAMASSPTVALADDSPAEPSERPPFERAFELGVAVGGHDFSSHDELGVPDASGVPTLASSGLFGIRAAYPLLDRLAIEAEAVGIPTKDSMAHDASVVIGARAHVRFDLLTGTWRPFLVAGMGVHAIATSSPMMSNDVDEAFHWGGGVRYRMSDTFEVRLDGRQLIVPDTSRNGATSDYEFTAGITYRFAKAPAPVIVAAPEPEPAPPPPPPAPEPEPAPPPPPPPAPLIASLAGIGFELDSSRIDSASTPILERAYELMHDQAALVVEIDGFTSSEGDPARNKLLSLRRAEAVRDYLVSRGIASARLLPVGHGSEQPIDDNATEDGRRKNRRIEFHILTRAAGD